MSAFVDNFLALIVKTGRSYIRDKSDFLLKLQDIGDLRYDELLLTLDVSSLYTNIPNDEGTMATLRALRRTRPDGIQPSNLSLVEMLAHVLSYNNFQFDSKNYLQVGGTAMGTRFAPSYANIFMNDFEERHVYSYHLQPVAWYHYIDDIFCLWQHGEDKLEKFTTHLNSVHETIKFTIEKSRTSVSFLNTGGAPRQQPPLHEPVCQAHRPEQLPTLRLCTSVSLQERTTLWAIPAHTENMQQSGRLSPSLCEQGSLTETERLPTVTHRRGLHQG